MENPERLQLLDCPTPSKTISIEGCALKGSSKRTTPCEILPVTGHQNQIVNARGRRQSHVFLVLILDAEQGGPLSQNWRVNGYNAAA